MPASKQHLDNLRRKDAPRGAETTEISVRLEDDSPSHPEGSSSTEAIVQRILSQKAVLKTVPVSRTTLWRMERDGLFPKRIRISPNRIGWLEKDIEAWMEER